MTGSNEPDSRPLPALIGLAFNQVSADLMEQVWAAGFEDLQLHHFLHVFRFMTPGGQRPARLAEAAGVTAQAMSLILADLERRGYLLRGPDPHDRRSQIVTWSQRGLAAGAIAEDWFTEREQQWSALVGDRELATARGVLAAIVTQGQR